MTDLKWLTPKDIYSHYLNKEAQADDGRLACEIIDKLQDMLASANSEFEFEGYGGRWEYERRTEQIQLLIRKSDAAVLQLMMKQAESGHWIASGRRHPDAEEEIIPTRYWAFLNLDIETRVAKGDDMTFRGIRGLIRRQIPKGHSIFSQIQEAETRPRPAALSGEIAAAHIVEAPAGPTSNPDQICSTAPDCPSHSKRTERSAPHRRYRTRRSLAVDEFRRRKQLGQTARTKFDEATEIEALFKEKYPELKPIAAKWEER